MAGVIDTNILLFAANRAADEHARAHAFLEGVMSSRDSWYVTEGIAYEFLRVATHSRVFDRPLSGREAMSFLRSLLASNSVAVLVAGPRHWETLETVLAELRRPAGNLFFDVRTATLMREHGVREIFTADTDFLQFGDIRVIDPLRS